MWPRPGELRAGVAAEAAGALLRLADAVARGAWVLLEGRDLAGSCGAVVSRGPGAAAPETEPGRGSPRLGAEPCSTAAW